MRKITELPRVYPITDKFLARRNDHLSILRDLVRGGARFVQIRDKTTPMHELFPDLLQCVEFAESERVTLILNDRPDLVLSSGAGGVHLGREDLPPHSARSILGPDRVIGLSTHSTDQVRDAGILPIQYIGFGPVFETATKEDALPSSGLGKLKEACEASILPVVAIGGIGLARVRDVLESGASSVAVISAIMSAPDIAGRMRDFREAARER